MKFSEGPFTIDKSYAEELRQKHDTFRRITGTRKNLFLTMVTTFGLRIRQGIGDELRAGR